MRLNCFVFSFYSYEASVYSIYLELAKLEEKFTNEQLEYLRHCEYIYAIIIFVNILLCKLDYNTINKFPKVAGVKAIAKQWNIDARNFFYDLHVSIFFFIKSSRY
jgi:hypothetical protein